MVRVFSLSLKEATLVKKGKVWKGHRSITFKESMALELLLNFRLSFFLTSKH